MHDKEMQNHENYMPRDYYIEIIQQCKKENAYLEEETKEIEVKINQLEYFVKSKNK